MTYNEFLDLIKHHTTIYSERVINYYSKDDTPYCFYEKGDIGGVSGGSCWSSSNPEPYTRPEGYEEVKEDFEKVFDAILCEVCPSISFLQYKNIYNKCVETSSSTNYEYYGNSTNYHIIYCKVKDFYDTLIGFNLL